METDSFFGTCHAQRRFIRQFDGKYTAKRIVISSLVLGENGCARWH